MARHLDAYLEGQLIGQFSDNNGQTVFEYNTGETPISMSMMPGTHWSNQAASSFLDNLLPDNPDVRATMARLLNARSTDAFDLLEVAGQDIAGGLVLVPPGGHPVEPELLRPATDDEIADRIATLKRTPSAWIDPVWKPRFALAGTQGKFALAKRSNTWYWPSTTIASTHILKPGSPSYPGIETSEAAFLKLARMVDIEAPHADVLTLFDGAESSYVVDRFDRDRSVWPATRIHVEDFAQATGTAPKDKYHLTAAQAVWMLARADPSNELGYQFIARLAFNVAIANTDAHAKNYSVFIRPDGVSLAPMYDVVSPPLWGFDPELAMSVGGVINPGDVTPADWENLARIAELDESRVTDLAVAMSTRVTERFDEAFQDVPAATRDQLRQIVAGANSGMIARRRPK